MLTGMPTSSKIRIMPSSTPTLRILTLDRDEKLFEDHFQNHKGVRMSSQRVMSLFFPARVKDEKEMKRPQDHTGSQRDCEVYNPFSSEVLEIRREKSPSIVSQSTPKD